MSCTPVPDHAALAPVEKDSFLILTLHAVDSSESLFNVELHPLSLDAPRASGALELPGGIELRRRQHVLFLQLVLRISGVRNSDSLPLHNVSERNLRFFNF